MVACSKIKCTVLPLFPPLGPENSEYQSVVAFLNTIPQDVLAKASFRSRAYTRAVMHFESFIREKKQNIQDHLTFLQVSAVFTYLHRVLWLRTGLHRTQHISIFIKYHGYSSKVMWFPSGYKNDSCCLCKN